MKRTKFFLISFLILFIASCGPEIIPVKGANGIVNLESKSSTLDRGGIVITVVSDAWNYEPIDVKYSFTPFLISVQNKTSKDITIGTEHIFMFDDNSIQYGVIEAEHVDKAVYSTRSYPPVIFYGGNYYYRSWGGLGLEFAYPYGYSQYDSKVIPVAFRFGTILSGATVKGFVYMQKYSSMARTLKLIVSPAAVDGGELPQLDFNFEIVD
ncbi:MAG: hypothetical protein JW984_09880 [Deltaproteobacteria bacterium]|uniref:Lipoprotein n=1 Tax=Candidatus Zymogenus saltonus TaxID=2844893 RepID=A0A9D8KEA6_9DELT|nr:hypothetical protein [Candidatus Zymogenus saltonus]